MKKFILDVVLPPPDLANIAPSYLSPVWIYGAWSGWPALPISWRCQELDQFVDHSKRQTLFLLQESYTAETASKKCGTGYSTMNNTCIALFLQWRLIVLEETEEANLCALWLNRVLKDFFAWECHCLYEIYLWTVQKWLIAPTGIFMLLNGPSIRLLRL